VVEGRARIEHGSGRFELRQGLYFSLPGGATLEGDGCGLIASRIGYRGFFSIGGPVESRGRLKYISGCSDSLLVAPVAKGDPCLNLLHMPPKIDQTAHTHPSVRIGVVLSGRGRCRTPAGDMDLIAGRGFLLPAFSLHSFHTLDAPLNIVVYHPDSDFGPTHDDHPMVNRTLVDGRSAADMAEIRTR
jgi:quercetin dioxygenase-like cupin family protein